MITIYRKATTATIDTTKRNRMPSDTPEKGTLFVRIYLKIVFGFIRHLDKNHFWITVYSNNYTSQRRKQTLLQNERAKVAIKDFVWYLRHDAPSFDNIPLVYEHIRSKKNTEYLLVSRMVSYKSVNSINNWTMGQLGLNRERTSQYTLSSDFNRIMLYLILLM